MDAVFSTVTVDQRLQRPRGSALDESGGLFFDMNSCASSKQVSAGIMAEHNLRYRYCRWSSNDKTT